MIGEASTKPVKSPEPSQLDFHYEVGRRSPVLSKFGRSMTHSKKRWFRLVVPVLATVAGFVACGGVKSGVIDIIDAAGSGGAAAGAAGSGQVAGQGGDAGAGAVSGSTGEAGQAGSGGESGAGCSPDSPCDNGTGPGLCTAGVCSACSEPNDDASCVAVYGKNNLCIAGTCIKAQCRTADDCSGGQPCVDNQCTSCASDGDCAGAGTVCNVKNGNCVANTACAAAANGAACPVNGSDTCCDKACVPGSCCGTDPCKVAPNSPSNDGACKNGQCVLSSCTAPVGTTRYVDTSAAVGGSGGKACPFSTLAAAVADLTATGGTVLFKSDGSVKVTSTLAIGPGINILGVDASFNACTSATCADPKTWPLISTGDNRVLNFLTPGTRQLRFVRLQGVGKATSTLSAIYASSATLTMDHVDVSGYQFALYVDTGGNVTIGPGVHLHDNHDGFHVADGGSASGGAVQVTVPASSDPTDFNNNDFGMVCTGNASLRISGPPFSLTSKGLISTNGNALAGIYWASSLAKPLGTIDGLEASGNGTDLTQTYHDGIVIFAHSIVKVRNVYTHGNKGNGLTINSFGTNTADGLSGIDLGVGVATNAGHNTFAKNGLTGLCIQSSPANTATNLSLKADGNTFSSSAGDCTKSGKYSHGKACTAGLDFSGACSSAVSLLNCTASNACQ